MKKILKGLLAVLIGVSLCACSNNKTSNEESSEEQSSGEVETSVTLKDGTYDGYDPQPTYLARALITVENGVLSSYEYEECHLPNFWSTFTEEEAAQMPESEVLVIEGSRGNTYYARHAVIGEGEEAIHLTANEDQKEAPNGSSYVSYGNDEIEDFSEYVKDEKNAAWYYDQILNGSYWVEDAEGNKLEDLAVYETTLKDGTVLNKVDSRLKTKVKHWTAVGTGVGTEGENGWSGNLDIIGDTLFELGFPEGEITKDENNHVIIADTLTSATIQEYQGYVKMFYDAYNKAKQ